MCIADISVRRNGGRRGGSSCYGCDILERVQPLSWPRSKRSISALILSPYMNKYGHSHTSSCMCLPVVSANNSAPCGSRSALQYTHRTATATSKTNKVFQTSCAWEMGLIITLLAWPLAVILCVPFNCSAPKHSPKAALLNCPEGSLSDTHRNTNRSGNSHCLVLSRQPARAINHNVSD